MKLFAHSITVPFKPIGVDSPNVGIEHYSIKIPKSDKKEGSYATRTSTIILVDRDNNVVFAEKNLYDKDEKIISKDKGQWFRFTIGDMAINCDPDSLHDYIEKTDQMLANKKNSTLI